ncbi:MAG: RNA methyltransferase, partial [Smithellaceae bacterium]
MIKVREASFMLYIALLHYPVYNKESKVVTTSIANMDIH